MGRLLLILVLVLIGVWLVRRALARAGGAAPRPGAPGAADELVGCAQCGVLLPRTEARSAGGAAYCSEEHARLGPRRR
ncbi:MAG TPA: PP0621 family protein [Burkholderiales bacterium]